MSDQESGAWSICVDCKERVGLDHFECPGRGNRRCKNCPAFEDDHFGFVETDACDNFEPVKYAGGASTPKREQELYAKAMGESAK